jgi:hypothetical protein
MFVMVTIFCTLLYGRSGIFQYDLDSHYLAGETYDSQQWDPDFPAGKFTGKAIARPNGVVDFFYDNPQPGWNGWLPWSSTMLGWIAEPRGQTGTWAEKKKVFHMLRCRTGAEGPNS